nr:transporter [uncultured Desulfuromonas sp.]
MMKWMLSILVVCVFTVPAYAELERTIWAWDTQTPQQGNFLAGFGGGYEHYNYLRVDGRAMQSTVALSYGLCDNWSAGLEMSYQYWREKGYGEKYSEKGLGDSALVTTYRFINEQQSNVEFAVRGSLNIPSGDEDRYLGSGNWEPKLEFITASSLGPVVLVTNLGVTYIFDAESQEEDVVLNGDMECVVPLTSWLSANAVVSGWTSRWEESVDDHYIQLGGGVRVAPSTDTFIAASLYHLVASDLYDDDWYVLLNMGAEF